MSSEKPFSFACLLAAALTALLVTSCGGRVDSDTQAANLKADSLSIKLNSPELKAVNDELRKDPNNAELYNKRAHVYMMLRQMEDAAGDAKRAIRLDSNRAEYWLSLADALFGQNKTRDAREYLEKTERRFPQNTEAILKLSELYFLVRDYQKAMDYCNKALKIDAGLAQAYYIKGNIYKESGDTAKAISSFETAVEQDGKFANAHTELGIIHAARRNPVAMDYYNNSLRIQPNDPQVKYARAKLLQDLGKTDEAIAAYDAIVRDDKNCSFCLYNLGALYLEVKKEPSKALEYFSQAIQVNPGYVEAYLARGYTYARLKDKQNARADYKMCLQLVPNYEPAIQGLNEL